MAATSPAASRVRTTVLADAPRNITSNFVLRAKRTLRAAEVAAIKLYKGNHLTYASSIAYYALLSFFPFVLLVFSLIGSAIADEGDRRAVLNFVLRYFPSQLDFVRTQLDGLRDVHISLSVVGMALMVWAALGVFGAITTAVNYAWDVETQPNYFQHKLVSFLMLLAAGLLMFIALMIVGAAKLIEASWFAAEVARNPWVAAVRSLGVQWAATLSVIGVAGLIFYFVPNTKVRFRDVWMGAVLTGLLWRLAFDLFSWYISEPLRFRVHGSIATVVVFLLWVYVSSVVFLYGVEFTAAYARLRAEPAPEPSPAT